MQINNVRLGHLSCQLDSQQISYICSGGAGAYGLIAVDRNEPFARVSL